MKAFIVGGAGVVGSGTASYLIARESVDEIVLQDLNMDLAQSHAMDLSQASFMNSKTTVRAGGWEEAKDADVVVIAAGLSPNKMSFDPCKDIGAMLPMIRSVCEGLNKYCPKAAVLSLTNPLDLFNYILFQSSGLSSEQFLGLSANDSIRFRWALGEHFQLDPLSIHAYVIGEHAGNKIPLFSSVRFDGRTPVIPESEQIEIINEMDAWWKHFLDVSGNRTAGWTTGMYAALTVEHIVGKQEGPICASAIIDDGVSTGYPLYLDLTGYVKTEELTLYENEQKAFLEVKQQCREKNQMVLDYIKQM